MKKYICIIFVALHCPLCIFGQQFSYHSNDPFGLQYSVQDSSRAVLKLIFYDVDTDDDLDAILIGIDSIDISADRSFDVSKYFIDLQENLGSKLQPNFAPRISYMNQFKYSNGYFAPAIGDLNRDGLPDYIICCGLDSSLNLKPQFYERMSHVENEVFNIIDSDSLGLRNFSATSIFLPELADMDMDGDLDLLMSGYQTELLETQQRIRKYTYFYAKNIGTTTKPIFFGWHPNPYGLIPEEYPQMSVVGDIDNDNDNDILSLIQKDYRGVPETLGLFSFIENIPQSNGKPHFLNGVKFPFGLPTANENENFYGHTLADIDGDGDLDLFLVQQIMNTVTGIGYYENNLCTSSTILISQEICQGDSVIIGSNIFKTTGNHFVTFEKPNRCDSTVHLSLTVLPVSQQILEQNICPEKSYSIGNQTFDQSGQYIVTLSSIEGCDSIVTLNLTVVPNDFTDLTRSICEGTSVSIGNNTFSQSGQYVVNLSNINGCDSVIHLDLTVFPKSATNIASTICQGSEVIIGNQTFNQSGQYVVNLSNIHGCDSVVNLDLTVFPKSATNIASTICQGSEVIIGNQTFNQTGQYVVNLSNIHGCDSVIHLDLTVFPKSSTNIASDICQGSEVIIGNQTFNQTGKYDINLININGCDSMVHLDLKVNPTATTNLVKTLCSGSPYVIGNQSFTQSGQYEVKLKTIFGCDSIVNAVLTFITLDGNVIESQHGLTANQNAASYQWFDCTNNTDIAGATSQTFIPVKNGKYGVRITDINSCQITSVCYDFVLSGIEALILSNRITLFPNPSDGYFTILNNTGYTLTDIKIINSTGITERILPYYQIERISTAGLSQGMYIIEMECNGTKIYKKLAVNKN